MTDKTYVLQEDDFSRTWDEKGNTIALDVEFGVDGDKEADQIQAYLIEATRVLDRIKMRIRGIDLDIEKMVKNEPMSCRMGGLQPLYDEKEILETLLTNVTDGISKENES